MTGPFPRGGRRIVVGVTGSLASLAALRHSSADMPRTMSRL
ncbi:hypothetical protein [Streptomyces sp. NPDC004285]